MGIRGHRSARLWYKGKDHTDPVLGMYSNRYYNRFHEKMYMESDYTDGLIWEKVHDDEIIISTVSWYPGSYSNNSNWTALFHPKEPYMSLLYGIPNDNFGYLTRTKDFGMRCYTGAYENPWGGAFVSKDGIEWVNASKKVRIPSGHYVASGWSIKENIGITMGPDAKTGKYGMHRLELSDDGELSVEFFGEGHGVNSSYYCGDLALGQGYTQDGVHQWLKFLNADGDIYTSILPNTYTWIDDSESDPTKKVKTANYNWSFSYLNGRYVAVDFGKYELRYWNEVRQEWQLIRSVLLVESDDGFKHIRSKYIVDSIIGGNFQTAGLYYYNNKYWISEQGYDIDPQTENRIYYFKVWDFGNSYMNTPKITKVSKFTMPIRGMSKDSRYDTVTIIFDSSNPDLGNRNTNRNVSGVGVSNIYFKGGAVTEPYGYMIFPTTFIPNGWSSNSYDRGGFMLIEGDLTNPPKEPFAVDSSNYMLDPYNATWGIDNYYLKIFGPPESSVRITELDSSYKPYIYNITLDSNGLYNKYFTFHYNRLLLATLIGEPKITLERSQRTIQTVFDFRDPQYNTECGYYYDGNGVFTTISGRNYTKVNRGSCYAFAVHYYYLQYGRYLTNGISPLLISSDEEFATVYDPGGEKDNIHTIEYGGRTWYYNGFSYGFSTDEPSAPYYIDMKDLGPNPSQDDIVLGCLKVVHPVN